MWVVYLAAALSVCFVVCLSLVCVLCIFNGRTQTGGLASHAPGGAGALLQQAPHVQAPLPQPVQQQTPPPPPQQQPPQQSGGGGLAAFAGQQASQIPGVGGLAGGLTQNLAGQGLGALGGAGGFKLPFR